MALTHLSPAHLNRAVYLLVAYRRLRKVRPGSAISPL